MSRISVADKKRMYELAEEIIECQAEATAQTAKGFGYDSANLCNLYDMSDSIFCAERVKSLLDELRETQAENQRLREGVKEAVLEVAPNIPCKIISIKINTVKGVPNDPKD